MGIASKPDDYLLKIKIQNNNIVSLMKENGIETIAELTRLTGVGSTVLCNLINMKDSPFSMTKNLRHTSMPWRPQVIKLADFFGVLPDEMFNYQQMYNPVKSNKAERSISEDNLHTLLPDFGETYLLEDQVQNAEKVKLLESALSTLTPREEKVLRARYGLDDAPPMTLEEVAVANDVTRERIRQIEQKAFRKMRNPDRADILKQAFDLQQANGYEREEAAVTFVLNARQKKIVRDCKQNADVRKAIKEHNIHEKSAWAYFEEIRAKEDFKLEYLKND